VEGGGGCGSSLSQHLVRAEPSTRIRPARHAAPLSFFNWHVVFAKALKFLSHACRYIYTTYTGDIVPKPLNILYFYRATTRPKNVLRLVDIERRSGRAKRSYRYNTEPRSSVSITVRSNRKGYFSSTGLEERLALGSRVTGADFSPAGFLLGRGRGWRRGWRWGGRRPGRRGGR